MKRPRKPGPLLNIFVASQLIDLITSREFERHALKPHAVAVLHLIWLHGPLTPTELELVSGMRPTTLRDRVNELVDRGEVKRLPNPEDGRSQLLDLTAAGLKVAEAARVAVRKAWVQVERELGHPLTDLDPPLEELIDALRVSLSDG